MSIVTQLPAGENRGVDTFSVAVIEDVESFDALLATFRRIEAERREQGRCFLTLDDPGQCMYTSGHARSAHGLDDGVDYPEDDTPEAVAAYELAQFHASRAALGDPARAVSWGSVCGSLVVDPGDIDALVALNRDPDLVRDSEHVVQCLPTDDAVDLLADIPNGYFSCDWNPFQSHAVARRLNERHGYALFGIGAATLGFLSTAEADSESDARDWNALLSDLQELYGHREASAWSELIPVLRESPVLLLGYGEDFAALAK